MGFGWEGELVRLVPLDRARHFDNAVAWLNDPVVTEFMETGDFPLTRGREEEFFRAADHPPSTDVSFAVETLDGDHVGFSALHRISWQHRFAVTGSVIGRVDRWGRGFGSDAARVRTRYAFDVLGLRLLQAEVMADNLASLKMLTRVGYERVGEVPGRYWKRGALRDQVILALRKG